LSPSFRFRIDKALGKRESATLCTPADKGYPQFPQAATLGSVIAQKMRALLQFLFTGFAIIEVEERIELRSQAGTRSTASNSVSF
jgi:hypothetical protein